MSCLMEQEGIVQKELAQQCHVEPATMTSLLQKMCAGGLIQKESLTVSGGKRAYGIYLTDLGRSYAQKVNDVVDRMEQLALRDFTQEEKQTLLSLLERLTKNIQEGQI